MYEIDHVHVFVFQTFSILPLWKIISGSGRVCDFNACMCSMCAQDFVVLEAVQGDSVKMLERIGLLADMRVEWEQRQILQHYVQQAPPELFGVQTVREGYVCGLWHVCHYNVNQEMFVFEMFLRTVKAMKIKCVKYDYFKQ